MNANREFCVKLIHCGNSSLANPDDQCEKNIFFMPMGLFALASALQENGFDAEIIHSDCEGGKPIDQILAFPELDAVGFDCHWVNQSLAVLEAARVIKAIKPEVFVFLGGFTASLFAEEILLAHPQIDAIIRGDAELPIVTLCRALSADSPHDISGIPPAGKKSLSAVPNLVWRRDNDGIEINDFSYVATAEEMEKLDFAAIDLLRHRDYYRKRSIYWTRFAPSNFAPLNLSPLFFLEVGRGCMNTCLFCGGNGEAQRLINNRKGVVLRSAASTIATIKKAMLFGFRTFFTDFECQGSDEWYRTLFQQLRREQLDIRYVYSSWRLISNDIVDALSETFERAFIQLSPETADVDLRRQNKGAAAFYTNDELKACLDYIGAKGNLRAQLYFGYFLAFERPDTVLRTIEFILELILEYPELIEVAYLPFSTDPGSLLFLYPERYDITLDVRTFHDYLEKIRDTYVVEKLPCPDMRLFSPKGIPSQLAAELERRVELFNHVFRAYRRSASSILQKTKSPEIILKLLDNSDVTAAHDLSEGIKETLLNVCESDGLLDPHLVRTIEEDHEIQKRRGQQEFKSKPQIWLDCETGRGDSSGSAEE